MDTVKNDLPHLFLQLGLGNSPEEMETFVKNHQLDNDTLLENASFWSKGQAQFIEESRAQDNPWSDAVDDLDALLRG